MSENTLFSIDEIKSPEEVFYGENGKKETTKIEESPFLAATQIYKKDGWISPNGIFWGCKGDEHDVCAEHLVKTKFPEDWEKRERALKDLNSDDETNVRKILANHGFIQLSGEQVIRDRKISEKQAQLLENAGIRLQTEVQIDEVKSRFFKGLQIALETRALSNEELLLVEKFLAEDYYWRKDNAHDEADQLFKAVTIGFPKGGKRRVNSSYYWDSYEYRYFDDSDFAVLLQQHKHDGLSGLVWSSLVKIVNKEDMERHLRNSEHSGNDYIEYWDDENSEDGITYPLGYNPKHHNLEDE